MWETLKEIYLSINKTSGERIKSPFYGVYFFTWLAFNWESVAIFTFSDMKMENRVSFINSGYPFTFFMPLIISIILTVLLPFINEKFSYLQSKPLTRTSIIMAMRKKKALLADIGVERFRAKRDVTYDRYKVGAEREMQSMKEEIILSKDKIGEITKEKELAIEEKNSIILEKNSALDELRRSVDEVSLLKVNLSAASKKIITLEEKAKDDSSKIMTIINERNDNHKKIGELLSKIDILEKDAKNPFLVRNKNHN